MPLPHISPYRVDVDAWQRANVTAWQLYPERAVLLVHDMQAYFVDVFERSADGQADQAIAHTRALIEVARLAGVPVVYTAQPPAQRPADRALLTDFWGPGLQDEQSARIIDELAPQAGDTVLTKGRYSAFHRTDLRERMAGLGRDQLIITGVYAHIGCLTTALVAFMEDLQVFFAADAMADFTAADHEMAARYVARRCGQVCTTSDVVDQLTSLDGLRTSSPARAHA